MTEIERHKNHALAEAYDEVSREIQAIIRYSEGINRAQLKAKIEKLGAKIADKARALR